MLKFLAKYRIEIKYLLITGVLLAIMGWLAANDVFASTEETVNRWMDTLADYGLIGMFIIGLVSNVSLVIQIPYNLPMFTLVIYASSIWGVIALGLATGLGGGIGEVTSYAVAHTIVANVDDLENSSLFRFMKRTIDRRPRFIPLFVYLASATPVPDFTIIVPMAMIKYPWKKMIIPMISGKITMNVLVALAFRFATEQASNLVSGDINFDLTAIIAIVFIMIVVYQVEKGRAETQRRQARKQRKQADDEIVIHKST